MKFVTLYGVEYFDELQYTWLCMLIRAFLGLTWAPGPTPKALANNLQTKCYIYLLIYLPEMEEIRRAG
jgi:hypothetical protein